MDELADVSARIQKISKKKSEDDYSPIFECPVCGKKVNTADTVTDMATGKVMCQSCYNKL